MLHLHSLPVAVRDSVISEPAQRFALLVVQQRQRLLVCAHAKRWQLGDDDDDDETSAAVNSQSMGCAHEISHPNAALITCVGDMLVCIGCLRQQHSTYSTRAGTGKQEAGRR